MMTIGAPTCLIARVAVCAGLTSSAVAGSAACAADRVIVVGTVAKSLSTVPAITIRDSFGFSIVVRPDRRSVYAVSGLAPGPIEIFMDSRDEYGELSCSVPVNRTLRFTLRTYPKNVYQPPSTLPLSTCTLDPDTTDTNAVPADAITAIGQDR